MTRHFINKKEKKQFYCPLGYGVMWWKGLQYSECPLAAGFRNMPECKDCHLKTDKDLINDRSLKEEDKQNKKPRKKKHKGRKKR